MPISFIVPTVGRPSLDQALHSIESRHGDEVIVVGGPPCGDPWVRHIPCAPGGDWGCTERTLGIAHARGEYLAFMDDDDVYLPGARDAMADAITKTPGVPVLFRMRYPESGAILWDKPVLKSGNVSTQMILIPNDRTKLGRWTTRREGDFDFLRSMTWATSQVVWRREVIAQLGHEDGRRVA